MKGAGEETATQNCRCAELLRDNLCWQITLSASLGVIQAAWYLFFLSHLSDFFFLVSLIASRALQQAGVR